MWQDFKENWLTVVIFLLFIGFIGFMAYGKYVLYDHDIRCLVVECRISK